MNNKNDIISILDAVNKINSSTKKKTLTSISTQNSIPKLNQSLPLPSDVDKLIREAEDYKKISNNSSELYTDKNQSTEIENDNAFILTEEIFDTSVAEKEKIIKLKSKINDLEKIGKQLRLEILNLKKNKVLPTKTRINTLELEDGNIQLIDTKETLKTIHKQVENQKQIFSDLKTHSIKVERDADVYRENYERLIIENSDLKKKLQRAKEQIIDHESNKGELLTALDHLNEILSKNNIINKISSQTSTYKKYDFKKSSKFDTTD
jgi:hypothetical protein